MLNNPNKLSQFWQELKRRKVTRTITVYAAAAFVTLELVSIIVEPLKLPEWTLPFIIVLLCVGFIIAIILSWIYDVAPEGGIVKTEPSHEAKKVDIPPTSNSWRIASYISFVVIVALVILNIIPRSRRSEESTDLLKSIAILPFKNISPDSTNQYLLDGIMEAVLNYLTQVENLRVIASTSVEQYRGTNIPISEIGRELNVNYILEGSGQKYEENFRLTTKLSDVRNSTLIWSNPYDRKVNDILEFQSEIAQKVVSELRTELSAEDRENLKKKPTFSNKAYQNYLLAKEIGVSNTPRAIELLEEAIKIDPNFVEAYIALSFTHRWRTSIIGDNVSWEQVMELAIPPLEKALEIDPNHPGVHDELGNMKYWLEWDFEGAEEEYLKAARIKGFVNGAYIPLLIQNKRYVEALEVALERNVKLKEIDPLRATGIPMLPYLFLGEYEKALEVLGGEGCWTARAYMMMGDYERAISRFEKCSEKRRIPFYLSDLAICYSIVGKNEMSNGIIEELIEKYDRGEQGSIAFMIGKIYSGIGEVDLAIDWLEKSYQGHELEMIWLYADPAFESLQDNEQYIDLLKRVGFDV